MPKSFFQSPDNSVQTEMTQSVVQGSASLRDLFHSWHNARFFVLNVVKHVVLDLKLKS